MDSFFFNSAQYTLCCISLGRCCLGLEIRVIIKVLKNPCYPINVDYFSFYGLILGLIGLIDAKGIDVVQFIWL